MPSRLRRPRRPGRPRRRWTGWGLVALLIATGPALGALADQAGTIQLSEKYPEKGQPTHITLEADDAPVAGAMVKVHYRPNSETTVTQTLGPSDTAGGVEWTPDDAGIVTLEAQREGAEAPFATRNVAVRYRGFPAQGLMIMLLAGVLLFGGAAFGFVMLLLGPGHLPAEEPPST